MPDDNDILMHFGGLKRNSLIDIINSNYNGNNAPTDYEPVLTQNSTYYDDAKLICTLQNSPNTFKILSLNCQSLNAKIDQIKLKLNLFEREGVEFNAICLQETWLSNNSDNSLLHLEGFHMIPNGKRISSHGGLVIYLKNTFKFNIIDLQVNSNIWEGQFIEIIFPSQFENNLILGNIYRPPRDLNENYEQFINEFIPVLNNLGNYNKEVIIAGDFNIDLLKIREKPIFGDYFNNITAQSFFPKITPPTRFSNRSCTLIDNFLYKISCRLSKSVAGILISNISDHLPYFISFEKTIIKQTVPKIITVKQSTANNVAKFTAEFSSSNLYNLLSKSPSADPNANYDVLEQTITNAINKHFPSKTIKFNKHKQSNWITKGIIKSIAYRDKLYLKLKRKEPLSEEHIILSINLKTYNRILKNSIKMAKINYYHTRFQN